jgi:hypothetical protein
VIRLAVPQAASSNGGHFFIDPEKPFPSVMNRDLRPAEIYPELASDLE